MRANVVQQALHLMLVLWSRDYTNVTVPSEQTRQENPANTNIMLSLFGEGGNHYNMLLAAGPRPGFHQQAGGSP
jgi:hypothetical protein